MDLRTVAIIRNALCDVNQLKPHFFGTFAQTFPSNRLFTPTVIGNKIRRFSSRLTPQEQPFFSYFAHSLSPVAYFFVDFFFLTSIYLQNWKRDFLRTFVRDILCIRLNLAIFSPAKHTK